MWLYGIHVANVTGLEKVMTFAKCKYIGIFRAVKRCYCRKQYEKHLKNAIACRKPC